MEPLHCEQPFSLIHDRQMLYVLMEELGSMPERYQVPLLLHYLEGHSRRKIAEQTDSTVGQIQGRLARPPYLALAANSPRRLAVARGRRLRRCQR